MEETQAPVKQVEINSPEEAFAELKNGNERFMSDKMVNTDYKTQIEHTKADQHPHSVILSCLDSRIPPEIIFDQGIGNIFVARVAGNIDDHTIVVRSIIKTISIRRDAESSRIARCKKMGDASTFKILWAGRNI